MKTYWGVEVQLYAFLTSALDGGVSFTLWPLYTRHRLDRRLGRLQSRSGHGCEENI